MTEPCLLAKRMRELAELMSDEEQGLMLLLAQKWEDDWDNLSLAEQRRLNKSFEKHRLDLELDDL